MAVYREHPLKILKYSAKNIWLLIFPLIRGIWAMNLSVNQLYSWAKGAWLDIIVVLAIMLFGFGTWFFSRVDFDETSLIHTQGIIFKVKTVIPYQNLASVTREYSFYLRPFGAVRIYADTCSGILKAPDMKMLLSNKVCNHLFKKIPHAKYDENSIYKHKPGFLMIFFFSALFSSSFSGMVYIAAFFIQGGQIAKDIFSASAAPIEHITEEAYKSLVVNIPYAAVLIALLIAVTWLLSFFTNMLRYAGFELRRDKHIIEIESGSITPIKFRINLRKVNYIDLRQNLIMKLFRVMSVNIKCSGYGTNSRKNMPVLMPVQTKKQVESNLGKVVKTDISFSEGFKPELKSFWQYIWLSVIISVGIVPITYILGEIFDKFRNLTLFVAIMAEIPSIWYVIINLAALTTSRIIIEDDNIQVKYAKGFVFHTVIGSREHFIKLGIHQTPFQKTSGICTVSFYFHGETTEVHSVKAIRTSDVLAMNNILFGSNKKVEPTDFS